ncbi:MAG: hypothetical protein HZC24_02535 [Rhodocyclales bacterium]|nr:hypothetical protein [Rhodocyclales bacterium]
MPALLKSGVTDDSGHIPLYRIDIAAVRDAQKDLGLDPCFRSAKMLTCTTDCDWRHHCRRPVAAWMREW